MNNYDLELDNRRFIDSISDNKFYYSNTWLRNSIVIQVNLYNFTIPNELKITNLILKGLIEGKYER